jgi:tRNA 2-selenouridine synthase
MAVLKNSIVDFINASNAYLLLDVRSPAEYEHAHIPGALSLPLFDNEQRAIVGTTYKKQSREEAIKIALPFFGHKMKQMVELVEGWCHDFEKEKGQKPILFVHCWRGGMRSAAVAWLLDLYGFKVIQLQGGYKAYRNWVIERYSQPVSLKILGGYTGSGKTETLHALANTGKSVIDLEGIANHKGSSFGALGQAPQPSQEMFENLLAVAIFEQQKLNAPIWIEDESQRIGTVMIPAPFFLQLKNSTCYFVQIPFEERLNFIVKNYGSFDKESLIAATQRIQKRLGGLETKNAIEAIQDGDIRKAFSLLLKYYDKWYDKFSKDNKTIVTENNLSTIEWLEAATVDPIKNANLLLTL